MHIEQTTVSDFEDAELYKSMTATPMVARCLQGHVWPWQHINTHPVPQGEHNTTPAPRRR